MRTGGGVRTSPNNEGNGPRTSRFYRRSLPEPREQETGGGTRSTLMMSRTIRVAIGALTGLGIAGALTPLPAQAQWQPTRPIEFIVPAGTGGGADQMARTIQGIVTKYNLTKTPMVVINKAGGAGGEGFL